VDITARFLEDKGRISRDYRWYDEIPRLNRLRASKSQKYLEPMGGSAAVIGEARDELRRAVKRGAVDQGAISNGPGRIRRALTNPRGAPFAADAFEQKLGITFRIVAYGEMHYLIGERNCAQE